MKKSIDEASDLQAISRRRDVRRKTLPALAQAGPVSVWMILFVTIPMLFIIYISFMSRGVFGDVVYEFSLESYQTLLDATYFKVILKSLQVAVFTTVLCLALGYPFAYYIARKPPETASKLIMLIMIPFWTNSLMRLNSWLLLFQTSGPINSFLQWSGITDGPITFIYTDALVVLGMITNMLPFAVLPLYSTIEKLQKSPASSPRLFWCSSPPWASTPCRTCWAAARSSTSVISLKTSLALSATGPWARPYRCCCWSLPAC